MAALDNICPRPPAPPSAWNHQIHASGGVGGFTTMMMVFVVCFCCVFMALSVWRHLSYVDKYQIITLRWGSRHYLVSHPGLHHASHQGR